MRIVETRSAESRAAEPRGRGEWHELHEEFQLHLAREALRRAAETLAEHAEMLAHEMDLGTLIDRGGPDALRLFAAVVRETNRDTFEAIGQA